MSVYFDTSSLVKLVLAEDGSLDAQRAWDSAGARVASVALIAELWQQIDGIVLTEELAARAVELAESCALGGYDAIHLASAEAILDEGDVMVVSDTRPAEA